MRGMRIVIAVVLLFCALLWAHSHADDPPTSNTPGAPTVSNPRLRSPEPSRTTAPVSTTSPSRSPQEVVEFAHAFVTAFARPDPEDEDRWRTVITTRVSDRLRENLSSGWDPQMTAWTTTTGPGHLTSQAPGEWVVDVPTDAGPVTVTIIVEHDRLVVTVIALERS